MRARCDLIRVSLGAHAAGALAPDERAHIDAHLASCADCRRELAELKQVSALLANLPLERLERDGFLAKSDVQRSPKGRARQVNRPRVKRWIPVVGAAAAIVALVVAVAALGAGRHAASQSRSLTASARDARTNVSARVTLQPHAWGTAATIRLRGVRPHLRCRLVILARNGTSDIAATWRANYEGAADVSAKSAFPMRRIGALVVLTDRNRALVRLPIVRTRTRA